MKLFADLTNDLCMWLTSCPQMFCCFEQVAETNTLNELLLTKCGFLLVTVIALLIMFNFVVRWWNDRLIIRDQRLESRPSYFQWKITTNSICAAETKLKKITEKFLYLKLQICFVIFIDRRWRFYRGQCWPLVCVRLVRRPPHEAAGQYNQIGIKIIFK